MILLGSDKTCMPTLVSEFARIYSLPTHKYNNNNDNFKRYSVWLSNRNKLIQGFTKYKDNYYMVAYEPSFYSYYSQWEAIISLTIISLTNLHQHYFEVILFW